MSLLEPPFCAVLPLGLTAKYKTHPKQTFSTLFFWAQLNWTADCNASPLILTAMQLDETYWQAPQLSVCVWVSSPFSGVLYKSIWKEIWLCLWCMQQSLLWHVLDLVYPLGLMWKQLKSVSRKTGLANTFRHSENSEVCRLFQPVRSGFKASWQQQRAFVPKLNVINKNSCHCSHLWGSGWETGT